MKLKKRTDNRGVILKDREYQRKNGTYEYRWYDKIGKRHSEYGRNLKELRELEDEVQKKLFARIEIDKKITINDYYYKWINLKKGVQNNTKQNYKYMYEHYVKDKFGKMKLSELKRTDIRGFYNFLIDTRGLTANTVDTIHNVIYQVLDLTVDDEYFIANPATNALKEIKKLHSKEKIKKCGLKIQEQELLENYLYNHPVYRKWYPICTFMMWSGMRIGEVAALQWNDVDMINSYINVNHILVYFQKEDDTCGYELHDKVKTVNGNRVIPMPIKVKKALEMEKEYQAQNNKVCKANIDGCSNFIFLNRDGNTYNQNSLNRAIKRIIRDCNTEIYDRCEKNNKNINDEVTLPNFSSHTFRHTAATRMNEAHTDEKARSEILGHIDIETTLDIYTDASYEYKKAEILKFDEFFNNKKMS